jgi:phenylacetate-CoA ligase
METISRNQPVFNHSSTYLQREHWTRQQIEDYQAQALQTCRAYAYAHSPFYQRFHHGLMDRPLQELPVLTKAMVMEQFDELVTDRSIHLHEVQQYLAQADASTPFLGRYQIKATSGSSGQPGIFLANQMEGALQTDSFSRFETWGGVTLESRVAVVASAAPAHMTTQFPIVINGQRVPRLQLSSNDPLETLVQRLNEFQPEVLLPYPSIAAVLANEQRQGRLHIAPHSVFCGAEPLPREMRQRIEDTWQTRLFDVYGSTEGGIIASECELHQGMHLFEDFSILEVVDQANRPVPSGEQGDKVLLTVFFRQTQPLIRYEVTDLVRLSTREQCPCGRPFALLESVEGRIGDMLYLPSITGREEGVTALQFQTIFDMQPVNGWQVIQELDGWHIFLTGASEEMRDEDLLDALRQMLTRRGVIVPAMEIHRVTTLTTNATGKVLVLISHVPRPSA